MAARAFDSQKAPIRRYTLGITGPGARRGLGVRRRRFGSRRDTVSGSELRKPTYLLPQPGGFGADYRTVQIGERSLMHTNPSPTLRVTLAYTRHPALTGSEPWGTPKPQVPAPVKRQRPPLRTATILRSAPGFCLNRVTRRPTSHFLPPPEYTWPQIRCPRASLIVSFVLYVRRRRRLRPERHHPSRSHPDHNPKSLTHVVLPFCLTARRLQHGGIRSVYAGRARRGLGVRRREPSARGAAAARSPRRSPATSPAQYLALAVT